MEMQANHKPACLGLRMSRSTNQQPDHGKLKLHLPEPEMWWESATETPNFIVFQVVLPTPFEMDFIFMSGDKIKNTKTSASEKKRFTQLSGEAASRAIVHLLHTYSMPQRSFSFIFFWHLTIIYHVPRKQHHLPANSGSLQF